MRLLTVSAKNVFSIGESQHYYVNNRGLVLVTGHSYDEDDSNGAGKSTIAHKIITWGLWGATVTKTKGDSVISNRNFRSGFQTVPGSPSECYVKISFFAADRIEYTITRTRNPATLKLESGGTDISSKLVKDTQKQIDQLLGMDLATWTQTNFFGQGRKLNFLEITPSGRREIIDSLIGLDEVNKWLANTREAGRKLDIALGKVVTKHGALSSAEQEMTRQAESLQRRYREWIIERDQELEGIYKELEQVAQKREGIQASIDRMEIHLSASEKYPLKEELESKYIQADIRQKEWSDSIQRLNVKKSLLDTDGYCKVCGSILDHEAVERGKKELEATKVRIEEARAYTEQAKAVLTYYTKAKEKVQEANDLKGERENLRAELDGGLEEQLLKRQASLQKTPTFFAEIETISDRLDENQKERTRVLTKKKRLMEDIKRVKTITGYFSKDFRNYILNSLCEFLTLRSNYYMSLLGNDQIFFAFNADGEMKELTVTVGSETGGGDFGLLSGGEQQLASFAVGLALADLAESKTNSHSQFMVLDEPFTNLGPTNCERVTNFLTQHLAKKKETIFLISNEENLKQLIPNQIHVEKEEGITRIVND